MLSNFFTPSSAETISVSFQKSTSEESSPSDELSVVSRTVSSSSNKGLSNVSLRGRSFNGAVCGRSCNGWSAGDHVMGRSAGDLLMGRLRWGRGRPTRVRVPRRGGSEGAVLLMGACCSLF
jgi:hypothetical protein